MICRLKSPVVWLSVIAQVCIIITLLSPHASYVFKTVATSLVEIATLFGVLNNPTNKEGF